MNEQTLPFTFNDLVETVAIRAMESAKGNATEAPTRISTVLKEMGILNDPTTAALVIHLAPNPSVIDMVPGKGTETAPIKKVFNSSQNALSQIAFFALLSPVRARISVMAVQGLQRQKEAKNTADRLVKAVAAAQGSELA